MLITCILHSSTQEIVDYRKPNKLVVDIRNINRDDHMQAVAPRTTPHHFHLVIEANHGCHSITVHIMQKQFPIPIMKDTCNNCTEKGQGDGKSGFRNKPVILLQIALETTAIHHHYLAYF
jgi:hypothetical protein